MTKPVLTFHGLALASEDFDPNKPHTYCRICGAIFQHSNIKIRKRWSHGHADRHSEAEHVSLAKSGMWLTPAAQYRLAAYGVIDIVSAVTNEESEAALKEAPKVQE